MNDIHDPKTKVFPEGVLRHNDITNWPHVDYSDLDLPIKLTEVLPEIRLREDIDESIYAHVVRNLGITVDRDELLRALNYERDQYAAGYAAGFKAAQPKWISVEERLPDESGEVMICLHGYVTVAWYSVNRFETGGGMVFFVDDHFADGNEVTHWMPLPEQPKEVNHE